MDIIAYKFGQINIDGREYHSDVIIFPGYVKNNWQRKRGHHLELDDIRDIVKYKPEILVIGTGMYGLMKIKKKLIKKIKDDGIDQIIIEKTKKACDEYNKIDKNIRKVGALHITC